MPIISRRAFLRFVGLGSAALAFARVPMAGSPPRLPAAAPEVVSGAGSPGAGAITPPCDEAVGFALPFAVPFAVGLSCLPYPTATPSPVPTETVAPTASPTASETATPAPTASPSATATATDTPTVTVAAPTPWRLWLPRMSR